MTPQEVVRRRRIQHWLLMAMRCLMLGLLALAFARPFIPEDQLPFISSRPDQSVVLLLDHSLSMQYTVDANRTLLDEARAAAFTALDEAAGEDEYAVVLFSNTARQISALDSDMALHRNAIQTFAEPSFRPTDYYKAIRLAEDMLQEADNDTKRIVLISDVQQTGWQGAFDNWKLDASIAFEIREVGAVQDANGFIDAFDQAERRVEGRIVHRFNGRLGYEEESEVPMNTVQLVVEGDPVEEQRIGGDELLKATFQYQASREGTFLGTMRIEDDPLTADNERYFTFFVENRPSLLGIGGGTRDIRRASYYLDRAFNQGDRALYDYNTTMNAVNRRDLADQHVVFYYADTPSTADVDALVRYVEEGGNVVVAFQGRADVAAYRLLLDRFEAGVLQDVYRPSSEQGYDAIIGDVDLRHPIFSLFAESGSGAIFRPRFRQYARFAADSSALVLGRYDTGDPFLIEKELGKGRLFVFTSSLSPEWTDFTINEMYIPFLYQVVKYALSVDTVRREYLVGDPVRLEGPPGTEWDIRAPGAQLFKVAVEEGGQVFFRQTEWPGHYTAANGNQQVVFSVNVDPKESMLARRDLDEAYGAVVPPPDDVPMTIEEARLVELDDEERQQKFWRYVILLMVFLFALETFIANRKKG